MSVFQWNLHLPFWISFTALLLIYRPGCASMYSWKEGLNHCDASYSTRQPTLEDVSTLQHDSWIYVARIFLPEISEDFPDPDKCLRYHVNEKTAMFGDCKEKQNVQCLNYTQTDFEPTVTACYQQDENNLPCFSLPKIHEQKNHQGKGGGRPRGQGRRAAARGRGRGQGGRGRAAAGQNRIELAMQARQNRQTQIEERISSMDVESLRKTLALVCKREPFLLLDILDSPQDTNPAQEHMTTAPSCRREVIMLVMVEKSSAELEAIYNWAMIWAIIADSKPRGHSRIGVETTDGGWTWLTTSIDLAVLDLDITT
uniref:Uncharacterized protein n=1 Tax=Magallana gigas TaxID=29159 RepID=A0A8W8KG32_MAGGI